MHLGWIFYRQRENYQSSVVPVSVRTTKNKLTKIQEKQASRKKKKRKKKKEKKNPHPSGGKQLNIQTIYNLHIKKIRESEQEQGSSTDYTV